MDGLDGIRDMVTNLPLLWLGHAAQLCVLALESVWTSLATIKRKEEQVQLLFRAK